MTTKNDRNAKRDARTLQELTGEPYAECLRQIRDGEIVIQRELSAEQKANLREQAKGRIMHPSDPGYGHAEVIWAAQNHAPIERLSPVRHAPLHHGRPMIGWTFTGDVPNRLVVAGQAMAGKTRVARAALTKAIRADRTRSVVLLVEEPGRWKDFRQDAMFIADVDALMEVVEPGDIVVLDHPAASGRFMQVSESMPEDVTVIATAMLPRQPPIRQFWIDMKDDLVATGWALVVLSPRFDDDTTDGIWGPAVSANTAIQDIIFTAGGVESNPHEFERADAGRYCRTCGASEAAWQHKEWDFHFAH